MSAKPSPHKALKRAVALAGSQSELARRLRAYASAVSDGQQRERLSKVTPQHVQHWVSKRDGVPPWAAIPVEHAIHQQVVRGELRPDIYPGEDGAAPLNTAPASGAAPGGISDPKPVRMKVTLSSKDVIPLNRARSRLSDIADEVNAGSEKIITKNGQGCMALIGAARLNYYRQLEHERIHLLLLEEVERGLADIAEGRVNDARQAIRRLKAKRKRT